MNEHIPPPPPNDRHDERVAQFAPKPKRRRWLRVTVYVTLVAAVIGVLAAILSSGREPTVLPSLDPVTVPTAEAPAPTEEPADPEPVAEPEPEVEEPVDEAEPDEAIAKSEHNERGNVPKEIGEVAALTTYDQTGWLVSFRVTDLTVADSSDADYADAPENGHFLFVSIEGETTADAVGDDQFWGFNRYDFIVLTEDGTRVNDVATMAAYSALNESDELPDQIGPSQRFAGKVALDVPVEHGYVILTYMGAPTGWEWVF